MGELVVFSAIVIVPVSGGRSSAVREAAAAVSVVVIAPVPGAVSPATVVSNVRRRKKIAATNASPRTTKNEVRNEGRFS